MNAEYNRAILYMEGMICRSLVSGVRVLICVKVVQDEELYVLEIAATDVRGNYWELMLGYKDFEDHLNRLGAMQNDWTRFFNMMAEAFENKFVSGEVKNQAIELFIDYSIGQAKLRGNFTMKHIKNPSPQLISNLVFSYIEKLEVKSLKRPREPSPETKSQVVEPLKIKAKILKKKKKPKQIGSKIL
ncbi:hypothetical protein SteCoe_8599 [Stentor coeruleus]|uniref:Uncharacterized protein n=1 Tax=Stentor coeruleus TaxID=5963 RepID=A0A1R2CJZ4_9CILI|nr:hypothetical protein SteCoe_8599 [Stentor coeruleus]